MYLVGSAISLMQSVFKWRFKNSNLNLVEKKCRIETRLFKIIRNASKKKEAAQSFLVIKTIVDWQL
jgi:hypothetical protein